MLMDLDLRCVNVNVKIRFVCDILVNVHCRPSVVTFTPCSTTALIGIAPSQYQSCGHGFNVRYVGPSSVSLVLNVF